MIKCKACAWPLRDNDKSCHKCGYRVKQTHGEEKSSAEPRMALENVAQEKPQTKPELKPSREHGFRRLGIESGDEKMAEICSQGAEQVPLDHPVEKIANVAADLLAFGKTEGGKLAFEALKAKFFGG